VRYDLKEVAQVLGLPLQRVRRLCELAGLTPGDGRYGFTELVILRSLSGLATRVSPRRMHAVLRRLPEGLLPHARFQAEGNRVVVRDQAGLFDPLSGQRLLDFATPPAPITVITELAPRPAPVEPAPTPSTVDVAFDQALALEDIDALEAQAAYRRLLEQAPTHVEAHINLGRLLHEAGELEAAEQHYRQGLAHAPGDPVAWFNLGVLLDDREDLAQAIAAYREALRLDPRNADAHFNLARLLERQGDELAAMRHLTHYRRLQP
jgi:uncharacterized protein HemY